MFFLPFYCSILWIRIRYLTDPQNSLNRRGWGYIPDYNVKFLSPEPGVRVAEVVALHDEGQGPLVHVQHHQELVGNLDK